MNRTFLLMLIILTSCTGDYVRGVQEFGNGNYSEARLHFSRVDPGSSEYELAVHKLQQIDSIEEKANIDLASKYFSEKLYADAEAQLLKIEKTSTWHVQAQLMLSEVDSARNATILYDTKVREAKKLEAAKAIKAKEIADQNALKQVKQKVRSLFTDLLAFKDKSDFKMYGFGVGYKYNAWLKDVQGLKATPEAHLLLGSGFVVGDLEMLGLEYLSSKGQETEYSQWAKKRIRDGLKK